MNNVRALQASRPSSGTRRTIALSLAALGIVFGDLGTSPLYALQASFGGTLGVLPTHANVIGIVSLFLWSLILMVSIKYVLVLMQADNHGEGGLLALLALLVGARTGRVTRYGALRWIFMAMFGTAMLYGDGIITPAFAHYTVPITVVILVVLFAVQPLGSGRVGVAFGPILAVWFVVIFALGLLSLEQTPAILAAFNPLSGISFFAHNGFKRFVALGAVVLATLATIVASQAPISAVFSLTRQAAQLGLSPRVTVRHTSSSTAGQIYLPGLNWVLMVGAIAVVPGFRTSDSLAAAFGIAVSTTMAITTMLFAAFSRVRWN